MSERRAVVFDLDGTLVDSLDDIVQAVAVSLERHSFTPPPPATIAGYVGDGARLLVSRSLGMAGDDARVDPVLATYVEYYEAHPVERTVPRAFARETLDALRGLPLAVCTNKPRRVTAHVLGHFGWSELFATVIAGGDTGRHKPHPEPLLRVAEQLSLEPAALIMVGDGVQDVACGRAAGAFTVGLLGGFSPEDALRAMRPDRLIAELAELPAIIAELPRRG